MPLAVHLEEDGLRLQYLRGERTIPAGDIRNVYPRSTRTYRGGSAASAIIELVGGGKIELAGYKDGTPMVVNVLRNWWEEYGKAEEELKEE